MPGAMILTATRRDWSRYWALYTAPMAPLPISASMMKGPSFVPGFNTIAPGEVRATGEFADQIRSHSGFSWLGGLLSSSSGKFLQRSIAMSDHGDGRRLGCCGVTRRGFLAGAGLGLVAGAPLGWLAFENWRRGQEQSPFTGHSVEVPNPQFAMPGPFPGRVIEVRHAAAVNERNEINAAAVSDMMARGMCNLTGADYPQEAWRRFFNANDVVGIKVNPVGY